MSTSQIAKSGIAGLAILSTIASGHCQSPDLSVDRGVFTNAVDRKSKSFGRVISSGAAVRRLTFWTQLRGTPELLQQMQENPAGHTTIRHVWRRYVFDGVETALDWALTVGAKEDLQKLAMEVAANGTFTWRTWSDKVNLLPGNWVVEVLWESDEPVMCSDGNDAVRPCAFSIEIR